LYRQVQVAILIKVAGRDGRKIIIIYGEASGFRKPALAITQQDGNVPVTTIGYRQVQVAIFVEVAPVAMDSGYVPTAILVVSPKLPVPVPNSIATVLS
jgi:hypothetical protein